MKTKIIVSPVDDRDYSIRDVVNLDNLFVSAGIFVPVRTEVRCQWFSSQCTCYAVTQAMSQQEQLKYNKHILYSPGFLYANREEDDYKGEGWYVRKALKQAYKYGTVANDLFPFPESYKSERKKFLKQKDELLPLAQKRRIKSYFRCYTEFEMKACINLFGSCIVVSQITSNWLLKKKITGKEKTHGAHAYILIGYSDYDKCWLAQDSYSIFAHNKGTLLIPYDFKFKECWGIERD